MDQLDGHLNVVARHAHLGSYWQVADTGNVGSSEVELRTIVVEEGGVTAAFLLGQDVHLANELGVGVNGAGSTQNLATLDLLLVDTTQQSADVVASLSVVQQLAEHLDTGNNGFLALLGQTNDLNLVAGLQLATLNSTGSNGTTTGDGEIGRASCRERV